MTIEINKLTLIKHEGNFKDFSFMFEDGNIYFIKGKNGIGKSSLINSMAGLLNPLSGSILYNGINFYKDSREERYKVRQKMGVIFDKPGLLSNLSIFENLKLRFLSIENLNLWEDSNRTREIDNLVEQELVELGLENKKDLRPHLLSQGEVKKVSITRALISNPRIIIWDDAFKGLTEEDEIYFENKILNIKGKKTIIILLNSYVSCKRDLVNYFLDLSQWRNNID